MNRCGQHAPELTDPDEIELWNEILSHQNHQFTTAGRGSRPGIPFTYKISTNTDGSPGAEMFVSTRSKSITRSTIMLAYRKVKGMEIVLGPKSIGVHGDSYIYAIFRTLGVIKLPLLEKTNDLMDAYRGDAICIIGGWKLK